MSWCLVCLCVVTVKGASGASVIKGGRTMSSYCHHAQGTLPTKIQNSLQYHVTFMLRRGGRGKGGSHSFRCTLLCTLEPGGHRWMAQACLRLSCSLSVSSPANLYHPHSTATSSFRWSQISVITTFLHAASPMVEFWTPRQAFTSPHSVSHELGLKEVICFPCPHLCPLQGL